MLKDECQNGDQNKPKSIYIERDVDLTVPVETDVNHGSVGLCLDTCKMKAKWEKTKIRNDVWLYRQALNPNR